MKSFEHWQSPASTLAITLLVAILVATALVGRLAASPAQLTGGNATLYVGTYAKSIYIIDEATESVVDKIPLRVGMARAIGVSPDRQRFYIRDTTYERLEIIDLNTRTSIDDFTLSEGNKKVRIFDMAVEPRGRYALLVTKTATKLADRFEIGEPELLQVDLQTHEIMRTIPLPGGEPGYSVRMIYSPDGSLLYLFARDVTIFETENFTEVDTWELSQPLENGFGRLNFRRIDTSNDEPGFFTGLFTVRDPVQNRNLMGIARVELAAKEVDFYTLGPARPVNFSLAPGSKRAYGVLQEIGHYEFWTFDLENRRVLSRQEFEGRPRMAIKASSNGKLLYIYQAGNTIDIYTADDYRYLRTMTLDADMTTDLFIFSDPPTSS